MQTLLTADQMRKSDEYTINQQGISSADLMENAATAFLNALLPDIIRTDLTISIFCGQGNNGGDGLAIARMLLERNYVNIKIYLACFSEKTSKDFDLNLQKLALYQPALIYLNQNSDFKPEHTDIVIDAILGSGLNKPLQGDYELLVSAINQLNKKVYAVDVPTGFPAEGKIPENYNGIKAHTTICFQRPKINFFFPESALATQRYEVVNIGLDEDFISAQHSDFFLTEKTDISKILKPRKLFSHKGTYGHALVIAGSLNTMGAALLSSMACLHAGAGLTTACIPQSGLTALNTALPEVMALPRDEYTRIDDPEKYQAIAIGPGLGIAEENEKLLESLIQADLPLVIDADALNILAQRPDLIDRLKQGTILTPHLKEFDRIFGAHKDWWSRVNTAKERAKALKIVIVLKNQYTFICAPDGKVHINPTGNPAMAQGGMGDILTGIITAFIAQHYTPTDAAILACYLHGKAGDVLAEKNFVVSASQVALQVPKEIKEILS